MFEIILDFLKECVKNPVVTVFGTLTLFEISPIKINPWRWLGNILLGELKRDVRELKRDFEETKAQDKRWRILDFANSCRNGRLHSQDEWQHVISELSEYEDYTDKKHIVNGVMEEDAKYLRELYHDRNIKNDFL